MAALNAEPPDILYQRHQNVLHAIRNSRLICVLMGVVAGRNQVSSRSGIVAITQHKATLLSHVGRMYN